MACRCCLVQVVTELALRLQEGVPDFAQWRHLLADALELPLSGWHLEGPLGAFLPGPCPASHTCTQLCLPLQPLAAEFPAALPTPEQHRKLLLEQRHLEGGSPPQGVGTVLPSRRHSQIYIKATLRVSMLTPLLPAGALPAAAGLASPPGFSGGSAAAGSNSEHQPRCTAPFRRSRPGVREWPVMAGHPVSFLLLLLVAGYARVLLSLPSLSALNNMLWRCPVDSLLQGRGGGVPVRPRPSALVCRPHEALRCAVRRSAYVTTAPDRHAQS